MKFSTDMFHWTPEDGLFSQELSSLNVTPNQNAFHRLYNDACDEGITLVSHITDEEATYYIDKVDSSFGDVQGWHLLPTPETIRQFPRLKNTKVLIIND